MQIFSKRSLLILGEATVTTVVGLIHPGAEVALTFGLAFVHICFDKVPVQTSTRILLILGEATVTSVVRLIHPGAEVALTFGLAFVHICFDEVPVQQYSIVQRVTLQVPIAPGVEEKNQESEHEQ